MPRDGTFANFWGNSIQIPDFKLLTLPSAVFIHQLAQELHDQWSNTRPPYIWAKSDFNLKFGAIYPKWPLEGITGLDRYFISASFMSLVSKIGKRNFKIRRRWGKLPVLELCGANSQGSGGLSPLSAYYPTTPKSIPVNFKTWQCRAILNIFWQRVARPNDFFAGQHNVRSGRWRNDDFLFYFPLGFCPCMPWSIYWALAAVLSLIAQLIPEMKGQDLLGDYIETRWPTGSASSAPRLSFEATSCRNKYKHVWCHHLLMGDTIIDKWQTLFYITTLFQQGTSHG